MKSKEKATQMQSKNIKSTIGKMKQYDDVYYRYDDDDEVGDESFHFNLLLGLIQLP